MKKQTKDKIKTILYYTMCFVFALLIMWMLLGGVGPSDELKNIIQIKPKMI